VKPYTDLERDIRRAMSSEPTPHSSITTPTVDQGPIQKRVEVCTALVADIDTFTVKRLRLHRLVKLIPTTTQMAFTPGIHGAPRSQYGNPYSQSNAMPTSPMTEVIIREDFTEEKVWNMDSILVDAVERVLAQSVEPTRTDSASSSRSSSRPGRRDRRAGSDAAPGLEIPRSECRQLVFNALDQVVKSVAAERGSTELDSTRDRATKNGAKPSADSTLKEGIRRWLSEVEEVH